MQEQQTVAQALPPNIAGSSPTPQPDYFVLIVIILSALFALIAGSYSFTWKVFLEMRKGNKDLYDRIDTTANALYDKIESVRDNDIKHLEDRLRKVEQAQTIGDD